MDKYLRKIAQSRKWQTLYSRAKELNIQLFNNNSDFGDHQINFLRWLEIYNGLYVDLALGEDYISEEVIVDDLRSEAYLFLKSKERKSFNKVQNKLDKKEASTNLPGCPSVIFKSRK